MSDPDVSITQKTYKIPEKDLLVPQTLGTWQEGYLLREIEFSYLLHGKPSIVKCTINILIAEAGYLISILPCLINHYFFNDPQNISKGEFYTCIVGIVLSIILYVISVLSPNDYKSTIKDIKKHFENAVPKKQWR